MADLVARARSQRVDYASGGVGTPSHLGVELLMASAGFKASHVPYKGASELVTAVLGQQVLFGAPVFSVAYPHVQAGKLVALGVASPQRNAHLPKVPTLAEQGIADAEVVSWGGVSVPAATPDAVVNRLRDALTKVLRDPQVVDAMERNGGMVDIQSGEAYVESFKREIAFTETMMKRVKLEPI
jgi:tripartite-type tricarboxylate transporter receptor subunit TctC